MVSSLVPVLSSYIRWDNVFLDLVSKDKVSIGSTVPTQTQPNLTIPRFPILCPLMFCLHTEEVCLLTLVSFVCSRPLCWCLYLMCRIIAAPSAVSWPAWRAVAPIRLRWHRLLRELDLLPTCPPWNKISFVVATVAVVSYLFQQLHRHPLLPRPLLLLLLRATSRPTVEHPSREQVPLITSRRQISC